MKTTVNRICMHIAGPTLVLAAVTLLTGHGMAARNPGDAWVAEIRTPLYFAVLVTDMDASVAWYGSVFDLEATAGSAAEDGSWRIENMMGENLQVELIRDDRSEAVARPLGFRKVGFHVADVEAVADRVAAATGARPRVMDFEELGQRFLQIKDPDGNTIQVFSRVDDEE